MPISLLQFSKHKFFQILHQSIVLICISIVFSNFAVAQPGSSSSDWPILSEKEAGIILRVLDAEQELAVSAIHLGVITVQLTNNDQSIDIRKPIDEEGFAVFTRSDLAETLDEPTKQITRLNLIDASGRGQRIAGHLLFKYDYAARISNKKFDAVVYLFSSEEYAPSEEYPTGGGENLWNYYRPNEMPAAMLVPPNETIDELLQETLPPVLLLHDVTGSYPFWIDDQGTGFIHELNASHHAWQFYYPYDQEIQKSADMLRQILPRVLNPGHFGAPNIYSDLNISKVPVVAHGMGGLVVRSYLNNVESIDNKIYNLLMLGTPNHGFFASYRVFYKKYFIDKPVLKQLFGEYPDHKAPAYKQMTLSSKFLHELNTPSRPMWLPACTDGYPSNCYLVIAGTRDQSEGAFTAIAGQQDGVVSVSSASMLRYGVPLITASLTHRELAYDTPAKAIKQFLKKSYTFSSLAQTAFDHIDGFYDVGEDNGTIVLKEDDNLLTTPDVGQIHIRLIGNQTIYNELSRIGAMVSTREDNAIRFEYGCSSMFDRKKFNLIRRVSTPRRISQENFFFSERAIGSNRIGTEIGFNYPEDDYEIVFYRRWASNAGRPCAEYTRLDQPIPFWHLRTTMFEKDVNDAESVMLAANSFLMTHSDGSVAELQSNQYTFTVDPTIEDLVVYFNASREEQNSNHDLKLITPDGIALDAHNSLEGDIEYFRSVKGGFSYFYIKNPTSGTWKFSHNESLINAFVSVPVISTIPINASFDGENYEVGDQAMFTISMPAELEAPLVKATLYREVEGDGAEPLRTLGLESIAENTLAGKIIPEESGIYTIRLVVSGAYQGFRVERELSIITGVYGHDNRDESVAKEERPGRFELENNYPNPFNPTTTIRFRVQEATHLTLKVFDVTGKLVDTLADQFFEVGVYESTWDAKLFNNADAPSGIYFYILESPSLMQRESRSMFLVK